jgi:hypothetical protein
MYKTQKACQAKSGDFGAKMQFSSVQKMSRQCLNTFWTHSPICMNHDSHDYRINMIVGNVVYLPLCNDIETGIFSTTGGYI